MVCWYPENFKKKGQGARNDLDEFALVCLEESGIVTGKVSYEFEDAPCYDFVIYYDSRENLIANGIMKPEKKLPEPFENTGYCKVV